MRSSPLAKSKKKKSNINPNKEESLKSYRDMLAIRRFEERAGQLYGRGEIGGFCHWSMGQEAVVVGINSLQQENDTVITTYRDHGHMIACGMDPRGVMAELTGRIDGFSKGKGGSMHMFSREKNFFGGHGIVGASVPLGTGLAFAHQYMGDDAINLCYFGDGAANQGQVYEVFNMAALWKIPVIYIIENNQYAMGTSAKRHRAGELYKRGEPYGIPGKQVDGQDILAVREAAAEAIDYVRGGNGPYLLEMNTYRYRGHSMSDPAKYRTKDEVSDVKDNRDPITRFHSWMVDQKFATDEELKAIDKEVKDEMKEVVDYSLQSPLPDASELWTDVLKDETDNSL